MLGTLKLGNICNNNCSYCSELSRKDKENMETLGAKRRIRQLRKIYDQLLVCGGEPALRKDIQSILKEAKKCGFEKIILSSNGRIFVYKDLLSKVAPLVDGFRVILFSLDEQTNNEITSQDSFGQTIKGIQNISKAGKKIELEFLVSKRSKKDMPFLEQFCRNNGIRKAIIHFAGEIMLRDVVKDIKELVKNKSGNLSIEFTKFQLEISIITGKMFAGPALIQFEVTNNCNHNCVFCYHHSPLLLSENDPYWNTHKFDKELVKRTPEWRSKKLSPELMKSYVDSCKEMGTTYVQLAGGGEPMTHPNIMEMIEYIKDREMTLQIFTNATLINEQRMKRIFSLGVDVLEINISAATPETYTKVHPNQTKRNFDRLIGMLSELKILKDANSKKKPSIRIMNTMNALNAHEILGMAELGVRIGAESVFLGPLQTTEITEGLLLTEDQIKAMAGPIARGEKLLRLNRINTNFSEYYSLITDKRTLTGSHTRKVYDKIGCYIGYYEMQVHVDETLAPCCLHPTILEIDGRTAKEIWHSEEYYDFRSRSRRTFISLHDKELLCRGCRMCVYSPEQEKIHRRLEEQGLIESFRDPEIQRKLDIISEKQEKILRRCVKKESDEKDSIWLKRLDMAGDVAVQVEANKLFRETIQKMGLDSKEFDNVRLISSVDNIWDHKDLEKKDWYEEDEKDG
jgi:MoaA/NifB/PqqE/SkfB family radical SAM enzyme